MKKTSPSIIITIIIVAAVLFAIWYVLPYFSQPGIQVSCGQKQIIGFKRVPPPLMAVIQTEICRVKITATTGTEILCSTDKFSVFESDTGMFPCPKLKDYEGGKIKIEASFFDLNNMFIDGDTKTLTYEGI